MAIDYENQLNKIKEAQKQSAIADLENTRKQTLSDLDAEREQNAANFNSQRNQANIQNQLAAKNFREYLVNSGRSNSGIMPQYEMNRQNNLQRSLNDITAGQNMALADINRRNTLANQTYNTGLQSANANIEAQYLNNLLAQQQAAWQREMQQKQFDEQVRQYNENLAFQKQQYADQLARQSYSGGGSSGGGYSGGGDNTPVETQTQATLSSNAKNLLNGLKEGIRMGLDAGGVTTELKKQYQKGKISQEDVNIITSQLFS